MLGQIIVVPKDTGAHIIADLKICILNMHK